MTQKSSEGSEAATGADGQRSRFAFGPSEAEVGEEQAPQDAEGGDGEESEQEFSSPFAEVEDDDTLFTDDEATEEGEKATPFHKHPRWKAKQKESEERLERAVRAEAELERLQREAKVYFEKYGRFKDPATQLVADDAMLSAAEVLRDDPVVASGIAKLNAYVKGENVNAPSSPPVREAKQAETPTTDPTTTAVAKELIQGKVSQFVSGKVPEQAETAFVKLMTDRIPVEDLASLTVNRLRQVAREVQSEYGLPSHAAPKGKAKPKSPPTAAPKAGAGGAKRDPDAEGEKPSKDGPKNMREWAAESEREVSTLLDQLGDQTLNFS